MLIAKFFSYRNRWWRATTPAVIPPSRLGLFQLLQLSLLLSIFLRFSPVLLALKTPERPESYISDYAGILSSTKGTELEEKLRRFEEETSNQIMVVIFPSLEGEVLEDFSIRLAEQWKIGQEGKDNGVILLIFKEDRQVRIEVGYGLEGVLPDATSKLIIENEIVPSFRAGRFEEGIESAIEAILQATQGEYRARPDAPSLRAEDLGGVLLWSVLAGALFPLLVLWILLGGGLLLALLAVAFASYGLGLFALFGGVLPLLIYFFLGRHGRGHTLLTSRGSRWRSSSFDWGGTGFGGGGFGGGGFTGGGGSFGGGGASGRW